MGGGSGSMGGQSGSMSFGVLSQQPHLQAMNKLMRRAAAEAVSPSLPANKQQQQLLSSPRMQVKASKRKRKIKTEKERKIPLPLLFLHF